MECWPARAGQEKKKSAEEADAGSEGETKEGEGEAVLPLGAGHKKGGHCDPVERHNAEHERESPGEIEKHGAPSQDDCKAKRGGCTRNARGGLSIPEARGGRLFRRIKLS
jgi:hypothetical protein